jgi:hypothetical protein
VPLTDNTVDLWIDDYGGADTNLSANGTSIGSSDPNLGHYFRQLKSGIRAMHKDVEWIRFKDACVYVSASSFKIVGVDLTERYSPGRRYRAPVTGGTSYGYIVSSAFSTDTTVVVQVNVGGVALDAGLNTGELSLGHTRQKRGAALSSSIPHFYQLLAGVAFGAGDTVKAYALTTTELDSSYVVIPILASFTSTPSAGSLVQPVASSQTGSGFNLTLSAAPGGAATVTWAALVIR